MKTRIVKPDHVGRTKGSEFGYVAGLRIGGVSFAPSAAPLLHAPRGLAAELLEAWTVDPFALTRGQVLLAGCSTFSFSCTPSGQRHLAPRRTPHSPPSAAAAMSQHPATAGPSRRQQQEGSTFHTKWRLPLCAWPETPWARPAVASSPSSRFSLIPTALQPLPHPCSAIHSTQHPCSSTPAGVAQTGVAWTQQRTACHNGECNGVCGGHSGRRHATVRARPHWNRRGLQPPSDQQGS